MGRIPFKSLRERNFVAVVFICHFYQEALRGVKAPIIISKSLQSVISRVGLCELQALSMYIGIPYGACYFKAYCLLYNTTSRAKETNKKNQTL